MRRCEDGDMVLIDTGCQVHGYQSDITRSYVFGTPSARQREFGMERDAQLGVFEAARLASPCEMVERRAARLEFNAWRDHANLGRAEAATKNEGYTKPWTRSSRYGDTRLATPT